MTDPSAAGEVAASPAARPLVLVGAPGAGKSTVGQLLASRLAVPFRDVDAVIETQVGKPVAEIFADDGEAVFRAFEESTTVDLLRQGGVVSLGGGAVMSPMVREALSGHRVVWLEVGVAAAARRVGLNEARPLLMGNLRSQLIKLLAARTPFYASVATATIKTDDLAAEQVVDQIIQLPWESTA